MALANQHPWWYYAVPAEQVGQYLTQNKAMLTDISAYIDTGNELKFAVVMAPADQQWWWYYGLTAAQAGQYSKEENMKRQGITGWRTWRLAVAVLVMVMAAACSSGGGSSVPPVTASPRSSAPLSVTSTLDGHSALPHRIRWQAFPSVPAADVSEVDYLIDGRVLWVEHYTPYFYRSNTGNYGNYLVTSFLPPGPHRFEVKVVTADGKTATDTVTATVPAAPAPPAALAGTWWSFQEQDLAVPGSAPTGYWRLVISKVGWQIYDTEAGGDLLDVAYLSAGLLEVRTGMATGHPKYDLNGWCSNDRDCRFATAGPSRRRACRSALSAAPHVLVSTPP